MGQAWGINRTMAQVHALLFIAPSPLDAEEISSLLDVSRSNVSTSLRELITWGVVRRVHIIGDRRDRFEALKGRPSSVITTKDTRATSWKRCSTSPGW
jgi:DNA-binding transcriptional regulator GbsR (MarR family)